MSKFSGDKAGRMKTVMILNAPPNAGKDYIADLMAALHRNVGREMFKNALYTETEQYFHADSEEFRKRASSRALKDKPWHVLLHQGAYMTPREALIYVSEEMIKPMYGMDYFGVQLAARIEKMKEDVIVVSDGGFEDELTALYEAGHNVILVRLCREGCSFSGDSRRYLNRPDWIVRNNGDALDTVNELFDILNRGDNL